MPRYEKQVIEFLNDCSVYPEPPDQVEIVQTHISIVAIAKPYVYKIKKKVDFGFVNYMSIESRLHYCKSEVALNSRLSHDVYLGVVPIFRDRKGNGFSFEGEEVAEYAVKMRYLPPERSLSFLLKSGHLTPGNLDTLAQKLSHFYQAQASPVQPDQYFNHLYQAVTDNFSFIRQCKPVLAPPFLLTYLQEHTANYLNTNKNKILMRLKNGWVRDCHGDLRLDHIYISGKKVNIIDTIEFNEHFRQIDVLNDLAFACMEMDFHRAYALSEKFFKKMTELSTVENLPGLLVFFKLYRALVRAKVNAIRGNETEISKRERELSLKKARRFIYLAVSYATGLPRSTAFIFLGRVGSGKSAMARLISAAFGCRYFSSDRIRKNYFFNGAAMKEKGGPVKKDEIYAAKNKNKIYQMMENRALQTLRAGRPAVLDATYGSVRRRESIVNKLKAKGIPFILIETYCDDTTRKKRLEARSASENGRRTESDARLEDMEFLDSLYEPPNEIDAGHLFKLDTGHDKHEALSGLLAEITNSGHSGFVMPV